MKFSEYVPFIVITIVLVLLTLFIIKRISRKVIAVIASFLIWSFWMGGSSLVISRVNDIVNAATAISSVVSTGTVKYDTLSGLDKFQEYKNSLDIPQNIKSTDNVKVSILMQNSWDSRLMCLLGKQKLAKVEIVK